MLHATGLFDLLLSLDIDDVDFQCKQNINSFQVTSEQGINGGV